MRPRRFKTILDTIEVPPAFDLELFCQGLQRTHGLQVVLVPMMARPGGACGWLAQAPDDNLVFVLYERATSEFHRVLIVLHELAHRLLGHRGTEILADEFVSLLTPDLDPVMVKRVLGRSAFTDEMEVEAETLATMLLMVLMRAARVDAAPQGPSAGTAGQLNRLAAVLEDMDPRRGW